MRADRAGNWRVMSGNRVRVLLVGLTLTLTLAVTACAMGGEAAAEGEVPGVVEAAGAEALGAELLGQVENSPAGSRVTRSGPTVAPTPTPTPTPEPGRPRSGVIERVLPSPTPTLTLTPMETPVPTVVTSPVPADTPTPTPTVTPTPTPTLIPVDIIDIEAVDKTAETVTIRNRGAYAVDVSLWVLVSQNGDERFVFPPGYIIPAGGTVVVASGAATGDLKWTEPDVWLDDALDPALLYDATGLLISTFTP